MMTQKNNQKIIEHFYALDSEIVIDLVVQAYLQNPNDQDLGKAIRKLFIQPQINTTLKND